jgi:hypothetical protein
MSETGESHQLKSTLAGRLIQAMAHINFPYKPTFSGHETFALRQLWLRKAHDAVARHEKVAPKGVFADESAIERFGVGKNMVSSIRHWALACDIIRDSTTAEGYEIGEIGNLLFGESGVDLYLENNTSIWLVHWLLAGRARRSATWYVAFNYITKQTFQPKDIVDLIEEFAESEKSVRSRTTLVRDVDVCIRCYASVKQKEATEDSNEPLLADLGLISSIGSNIYQFNRGPQYSLSDAMFSFALLDFWSSWEARMGTTQTTLSFNTIAHEYGSPGRVFKLSEDAVAERLSEISESTGRYLEWTDSSGLRQVSKKGAEDIDSVKMRILRNAYEH